MPRRLTRPEATSFAPMQAGKAVHARHAGELAIGLLPHVELDLELRAEDAPHLSIVMISGSQNGAATLGIMIVFVMALA